MANEERLVALCDAVDDVLRQASAGRVAGGVLRTGDVVLHLEFGRAVGVESAVRMHRNLCARLGCMPVDVVLKMCEWEAHGQLTVPLWAPRGGENVIG